MMVLKIKKKPRAFAKQRQNKPYVNDLRFTYTYTHTHITSREEVESINIIYSFVSLIKN